MKVSYIYKLASVNLIMNKKGKWIFWVSLIIVLVLIGVLFFYFVLYKPQHDSAYMQNEQKGEIINPVGNLSIEEAITNFDESFLFYLLYSIKAYNLHNPPLSSDKPKINILVDDDFYNAVIENGRIDISIGEIENPDIIIRTSKEESVKMLKNKGYIQESFSSERSKIELKASKSVLFSKGYLSLYNEITGKSVTGNVIRIYTG